MFRKLLALVFLIGLAAAVWFGARWFREKDDVQVTVIFSQTAAGDLRRGDAILTNDGKQLGTVRSVSKLDDDTAVKLHIEQEHQDDVLTDSIFLIERRGERPAVVVLNSIAVGAPVDDGAVIRAREDKVALWIAKRGAELKPALEKLKTKAQEAIDSYDSSSFKRQLDEWSDRLPEWKREGGDVYERNLTALKKQVDKMEQQLRRAEKNVEADRLRRDFNAWLERMKEDK